VDGDLSGGPFIKQMHPLKPTIPFRRTLHSMVCMRRTITSSLPRRARTGPWFGAASPWIKNLPYANHAYTYNFKHGEGGKLLLEFYITPFDYAGLRRAATICGIPA
jgi:hypothetical protein